MFTLQQEPGWTWPVMVKVPSADGAFTTQQFSARWRLLPQAERDELARTDTDELLRRSVVELLDLVDEAGTPLPHSAELLDACIGHPWIRTGLIESYVAALAGTPLSQAARGN